MHLWLMDKKNHVPCVTYIRYIEELVSMEFVNLYQYHSPPKVSYQNTTYNPIFEIYI
jgi:hypothetical protein